MNYKDTFKFIVAILIYVVPGFSFVTFRLSLN